ncbi:oligosaccharide flippase family protein [Haloterrigena salifodinae]|uniref:oligosaccharide flippase family protein n=1 Tax=Haloterrigena salifodinae TaxID=2675099 RepID=UPI000F88FC35|nr:lipopolysaccharide biosynthesis protein [Haloterrigena salifodinae]
MSAAEADFGIEISKGVLAKFFMAAVGFAGSVVFARVLGPTGYGAFYLLLTLVEVLDNPVTGWGDACKKRITEAGFPMDEALGASLVGAVAASLVVVPLAVIFGRTTTVYNIDGMVVPFAVLFMFVCLFASTNRVLSARSNFSAADWSDTLRSFLTTPLQLGFVLLGFGAAGMAYGLAAATALTVPYVLWKIHLRPSVPSWESLASIRQYAKYSVPNGFLGTALSRMDILLLGALLSSAAVGKYQATMQLTMPGTFIGGVASAGLMGRVSEYKSRNDETSIRTDVENSLGHASVIAIPIFFGAAAMPNDLLVTVFGSEYSGVGLAFVGIALFRIVSMQTSQAQSTISGIDRPDINTRVSAVVLVLNLGLGYLLLRWYGIVGVVAATVVSEFVKYTLTVYALKQYLPDVPVFTQPFRDQILAGGVMFITVEFAHGVLGISWWGELLFLISLGGAIYFAALVAISESFRITVRGILSDALSD